MIREFKGSKSENLSGQRGTLGRDAELPYFRRKI
jgi:hypothetical protein